MNVPYKQSIIKYILKQLTYINILKYICNHYLFLMVMLLGYLFYLFVFVIVFFNALSIKLL